MVTPEFPMYKRLKTSSSWKNMTSRAPIIVHTRYARCPIASPSAKYSHKAIAVSTATATATTVVEPHSTSAITTGISTTAVATRFHVIVSTLRHSERSLRSEEPLFLLFAPSFRSLECPLNRRELPRGTMQTKLTRLYSQPCPTSPQCSSRLVCIHHGATLLNLRVPHPSRSLRRVGSYGQTSRPLFSSLLFPDSLTFNFQLSTFEPLLFFLPDR